MPKHKLARAAVFLLPPVLVTTGLLGVAAAQPSQPAGRQAAAAPSWPAPGNGWNADDGAAPSNYRSYTVVMSNSWNHSVQQAAAAAGDVPIEYKDLTSTRADDCGTSPGGGSPCIVNGVTCPPSVEDAPYHASGLAFCWTWRKHPSWFLTRDGRVATHSTPLSDLVTENGFPTQYMMDWGNKRYQYWWGLKVAQDALANGWKWVFADNALTIDTAYTNSPLPQYPTNAAVQAATLSMLKTEHAILNAFGIRIVANVGYTNLFDHSPSDSLWDNWLPYVDGLQNERYVQGYSGDIADQQQNCLNQHRVCFFGATDHSGIQPNFTVVTP